ncbi:MAG: hypothetical protein ABI548_09985 [Polyangiaceae bacterium]
MSLRGLTIELPSSTVGVRALRRFVTVVVDPPFAPCRLLTERG